jgi:sulfatase modifying factor 1
MARKGRKRFWFIFFTGVLVTLLLIFSGEKAVVYTSTDKFCAACHVHPHSDKSWKLSTHYDNQRGIVVHCVDCHLPPHGEGYLVEKIKTGTRDVYGKLFKDIERINWEEKSRPEIASRHSYESSCIACHENLFPIGLTEEGSDAHLYYSEHEDELHCINCHLNVGHYSEHAIHAKNVDFGTVVETIDTIYDKAAEVTAFENFTDYIPGTGISFNMVAIPGGTFTMGSPPDEPGREPDEGPVVQVELDSFFIGKVEVTWNEYLAFFNATGSEGKTSDAYLTVSEDIVPDAITGPTPPWGAPDQGWGKQDFPAITMTPHAADVYCQWLSKVTGKKYRLPTEAEWEYAARGGTTGPYFFEGDPEKYESKKYIKKQYESDTAGIVNFIIYTLNSRSRTIDPGSIKPNPYGLVNLLGNVAEICRDWYDPDIYSTYQDGIKNPAGPETGEEKVIRGGSFRSAAGEVRCASRDHTQTVSWLKTDPQIPKSIWWYSDCIHVGFRVVCEYDK